MPQYMFERAHKDHLRIGVIRSDMESLVWLVSSTGIWLLRLEFDATVDRSR